MKAQKFAVIGLGSFGFSLATKLEDLGAEVLAIDQSERIIQEISNSVSAAVAFDCTDENMLEAHGLASMDLVIVAIGEDFGSNVLVTKILKDMGLVVHSRATSKREARILKAVGADHIYTPEQTQGVTEARRLTLQGVESYIPLSGGIVFAHVEVKPAMVGRMLRDLDIRKIFGLNIAYIGRMTEEGRKYRIPRPDDVFREDDHIFIMGTQEDIKRYLQS
ncbi:MAG: TrkA family potassium uptake protein [Candidatus Fermentibacteraceae bacterium]|nr:TrkA family potassium uptake protein [Candidatus Fermentibacteraceae bacterium]MBN2608763.1 TrkA family potassium uptake protein [Candidatus Fermentibacteraceae bacterium]